MAFTSNWPNSYSRDFTETSVESRLLRGVQPIFGYHRGRFCEREKMVTTFRECAQIRGESTVLMRQQLYGAEEIYGGHVVFFCSCEFNAMADVF